MYLTVCPLHNPGSIPSYGGVFQEIFLDLSHTGASRSSPITHPGKRWVKDWVGQFLYHSWPLFFHGDMKKNYTSHRHHPHTDLHWAGEPDVQMRNLRQRWGQPHLGPQGDHEVNGFGIPAIISQLSQKGYLVSQLKQSSYSANWSVWLTESPAGFQYDVTMPLFMFAARIPARRRIDQSDHGWYLTTTEDCPGHCNRSNDVTTQICQIENGDPEVLRNFIYRLYIYIYIYIHI